MAMQPVYSLNVPGRPNIEISQDELRSILGQIETQLHRSKVYHRALAELKKLGESADQAKELIKIVGREAIGLAFQQFAKQPEFTTTNTNPQHTFVPETVQPVENSPHRFVPDTVKPDPVESPELKDHALPLSIEPTPNPDLSLVNCLAKQTKKHTPAEIAEIASAEHLSRLNQISQQLRITRESQYLSLAQIHAQTRVPIHIIQALENGEWERLPEEIYIRGFIHRIGDTLGLDGAALAASIPKQDPIKAVLPTWYRREQTSPTAAAGFQLQPIHLYATYTALVAGAVGGLGLLSQQSTPSNAIVPHAVTPAQKSTKQVEPSAKPGVKTSQAGVVVGADMAPPEAL
jgi:cytoskeleton protein RodZ